MKRVLCLLLGALVAGLAGAAPVTLRFHADGFQNAGTPYPGLAAPIDGTISWEGGSSPFDPVGVLTGIDLTIGGHSYDLSEVGIANEGTTQTAIGALFRGANTVVGDGAGDDFLLVFDRVNPVIHAFAFSVLGKPNAIWWNPSDTRASFDAGAVPEPGSLWLAGVALVALPLAARRRPAD